MATVDGLPPDPLLLLRKLIASNKAPIPSTNQDPSAQAQTDVSLAQASYLIFNIENPPNDPQHIAIPLIQETRFINAAKKAIDLRSIYITWLVRDKSQTEYVAAVQSLNEELEQAGKGEQATNLSFAEKSDLILWLSSSVGENDCDFIKSLDDNIAVRAEAADAAKIAAGDGDIEMRDAGTDEARTREEAERLRLIYAGERKMGDHNTFLRGMKVQDFSDFKKYSGLFLGKARPSANAPQQNTSSLSSNPALRPPVKPSQSGRRPEPIILLSSSFSSLLRMPNIKSFLAEGVYTPLESSGEAINILHISRNLRTVHPGHSTRFILVDDPTNFRPDYWNRVVAVFTTGQTWQFKNYKWQNPAELFSHALGVYVGWKGEFIPDTVKGWGRGVLSVQIDKGTQRWRDREIVEEIWSQIEGRMRAMGWGKDGR